MRVQKLALAVGLVSALGGNAALALGLGEIKLNSTLNQPLNAEIKLLQTRGLGESEIKVRLANTEDFERAGVDRAYLLDELRFTVDYSTGQPVVRVSSRAPIREPFLNFLVETRWPSGRLLREYTLLMDLPAFSTNTASQPVRAAERERQQIRREAPVQQSQPVVQQVPETLPEPVQAPVEQPAPAAENIEPQEAAVVEPQPVYEEPVEQYAEPEVETAQNVGSRVYGPVEANNTLWEIARDSRETRELSVQQTMLAIQRLNPEAFINNNINLLKKGAVLRLPTTEEVRTLSRTEAVSQVATQNDSWRERAGDVSNITGAPLDGRAITEESAESDALEGRVSLAAPGDNESVLSGSGSGTGESDALVGELAVSEEELDKSRLENTELQERIGELNEQIDTMERLVDVSNEEMQAVQSAAEQTAAAAAADASSEESAFAADQTDAQAEVFADEVEALEAAETVPAESAEAEAVEAAPETDNARNRVVIQTRPEPTLVERLMDNIQLIGIGVGALLIGLFGFISWRRRREEEEAIRQVEAEMAAERALAEAPSMAFEDDNLAAVEEMEASDTFDLDQLGEVETDDPVAEAEIHLSLAQYQEAEAKLLAGLTSAPNNVEARLMLLEVYAHLQSGERFDDHYRQLLGYSDGPATDRAAGLRETIEGIGPFDAPESDFSSESLEATQLDDMGADIGGELGADFDIEASFDDLDEFSSSDTPSAQNQDDDFGTLDDLTLDLGGDGAGREQEVSLDDNTAEDGEFSLELDLGDDLDLGVDLDLQGDQENELGTLQLEEFAGISDLDLDTGLQSEVAVEPTVGEEQNLDGLDDLGGLGDLENFEGLDNLGNLGDLDLELGSDFGIESDKSVEPAQTVEDSGLEFNLDLTPMEESGELDLGGNAEEPVEESAELDNFSGELDDLDLDSIDLGDLDSLDLGDSDLNEIDLSGSDLGTAPAAVTDSSQSSSFELEGGFGADLDLAELEDVAPQAAQQPAAKISADDSALGDLNFDLENDLDSELNLLEGNDEVSTKLELAQAYLDMGDKDGAREILGEVVEEAAGEHQQRAKDMLERMA